MNSSENDLYTYSDKNLLSQAESAEENLGYKLLRFYVDDKGIISKVPTQQTEIFYLSPSGGTLRDKDMNLVLYSAKFDKFKGYGKL